MDHLLSCCRGVWRDQQGLTAIEYAIMAGFIASAVVYGVTLETEGIAYAWQVVKDVFAANPGPS